MIANHGRWVAILGGASDYDQPQLEAAYHCGRELAARGKHLITGATNGIPYAASLGAKDAGGLVVGISPASSPKKHLEHRPLSATDIVIFSGLGADGRAPLILRSASAAIFIGGQMGTLAEFAAGWLCGCPVLGVLESSGGVSGDVRRIVTSLKKQWGSRVVYADEVQELVQIICAETAEGGAPHAEAGVADVLAALRGVRSC